jgi:uncharacterized RDD family membrane protein YckC
MAVPEPTAPTLGRRLACNLYETLLLLALLILAGMPFGLLLLGLSEAWRNGLLRVYWLLLAGLYLVYFWRKGQTLAMKTWRIRLESVQGARPSVAQLWLRYLYACLNLALLGAGWWYALVTPDRQFLQDRLAGTRLVAR